MCQDMIATAKLLYYNVLDGKIMYITNSKGCHKNSQKYCEIAVSYLILTSWRTLKKLR